MNTIHLLVEQTKDEISRENFRRIVEGLKGFPFLQGDWRFVEIEFGRAETNFKYRHGLNFVPRDVIQTSVTGAGAVTWNYSSFDKTNLDITTTGACVVRAFVGKYSEGA